MMRLLYDAANGIEAHMILNMLEQAGLAARIDGEYLQGGVGELQTMGIVRVMIEENDYAAGKALVDQWDENQPLHTPRASVKSGGGLGYALLGFLLGVGVMTYYYSSRAAPDTCDHSTCAQTLERLEH